MAPEVLSEGMNINDFESYKRADVYSFSLVMWETAQCAIVDGEYTKSYLPTFPSVVSKPKAFWNTSMVNNSVISRRKRSDVRD